MHVFDVILIFTCLSSCSAMKILVYNPMFGFSHVKFLSKMVDVIASRGHEVTSFQPFHFDLKNTEGLIKNKNATVINYYPTNFKELQKNENFDYSKFWESSSQSNPLQETFHFPKTIANAFEKTSAEIMLDTKLHQNLRSKNFQVVLYEPFDVTGLYLANLLSIPAIPVLSMVRFDIETLFGAPSTLGYVPPDGSMTPPSRTLFARIEGIFRLNCHRLKRRLMFGMQTSNLERALGHELPDWRVLMADTPLMFANANPYLDFAVPTTDNVVRIGGITMNLKRKNEEAVPEEYEKILAERERTVLISFGSVVRSFEMPERFKSGVIEMFHNLPNTTFIWKYEIDDPTLQSRLPPNVHLRKWVPQPALLADERLSLFVTHGGLGSTMEVAYTGKPALMIPIFADQPHNAVMLARHGGALAFDKFDLADGGKLTATIADLTENQEYAENAKMLLEVLRNQPYDPKEELLKRLEFAVKFPKHRSFRPEINQLGVIEFYHLDALAVILITLLLFLYVFTKFLVFLISKIVKNKLKKE